MADPAVIGAVVAAAPARPGQRVLDVACGAGFLLRAYRDSGAAVFGVDLSAAMLRAAGQTLGPSVPPRQLIRADAARLPFGGEKFDWSPASWPRTTSRTRGARSARWP